MVALVVLVAVAGWLIVLGPARRGHPVDAVARSMIHRPTRWSDASSGPPTSDRERWIVAETARLVDEIEAELRRSAEGSET